jgi:NADH:ubiquinone oxidoreductase subunit 5 (subunit L)/multisubunit Na+/H+ antiporter MnhA subunit
VPGLALLGLTGALLHTLNHALFKSLLFLGAGAVVRATGTRDLARLGGLARAMPRTAAAFLVGSLAIVGLPPLNGFVSEWMIFRGLLEAGGAASAPLRAASAATVGLALTGALALACFTKLHGTVFLGKARAPLGLSDRSPDAGLTAPQLVLAGACMAIGVLPLLVVPAAAGAATLVAPAAGAGAPLASGGVSAAPLSLVALGLAVLGGLLWRTRFGRAGASAIPAAETWACAYPRVTSRMQYGASGFAASLLAAFGPLSGTQVVSGPGVFEVHAADPILDRAGRPLWGALARAAARLRVLQAGRLRWYLLYVILSLLALLVYLWTGTAR